MMRDFNELLAYCSRNMNYDNMAYNEGFARVLDYESHNREGHYTQLFYATYDFLNSNRGFIVQIGPPPFDIQSNPNIFNAWSIFINNPSLSTTGYNMNSIISNLSPSCGGTRIGGGGWSPIAKIMFSVVAKYLS